MSGNQSSVSLVVALLLLGAGLVAGYFLRPLVEPPANSSTDPAHVEDAGHGSDVVSISERVIDNLQLTTGKFQVRNFTEYLSIPAVLVEKLPMAHQIVVAPIQARVENVLVSAGQSVSPGDPLFELRITDERIGLAQAELLTSMTTDKTVRARLERVKPLVSSGAVADRRILELEAELEMIDAKQNALARELEMRGLDESQLQQILEGRPLKTITVYARDFVKNSGSGANETLTVASVDGIPGSIIEPGGCLCELSWHGKMLVRGMAFERDVDDVTRAGEDSLSVIFGDAPEIEVIKDLKLLSIDNRVDEDSQTYPVYVELENRIAGMSSDSEGREYIQWKYKPGQRCHIQIPLQTVKNAVVVPLEAVVTDGPADFVYQKLNHSHSQGEEPFLEFRKIPVKVLMRDRQHAVLEKQTRLDLYENYVLDQAFQVHLALNLSSSGGAGGGHGHSHE